MIWWTSRHGIFTRIVASAVDTFSGTCSTTSAATDWPTMLCQLSSEVCNCYCNVHHSAAICSAYFYHALLCREWCCYHFVMLCISVCLNCLKWLPWWHIFFILLLFWHQTSSWNCSSTVVISCAEQGWNVIKWVNCVVIYLYLSNCSSKECFVWLECGPVPNVIVALPNIGGALCSTTQTLADAHY